MRRKYYLVFAIIILAVVFLIISFVFGQNNKNIKDKNIKLVCANEYCFTVEIADEPEERSRGLMDRKSLDSGKGMLFIFGQESKYYFWMKNTLVPLDIIWLNSNKEVIYIEKNVQPCQNDPCPTYGPDKEAKYVLEINAGQSDRANIQIGTKLSFEFK